MKVLIFIHGGDSFTDDAQYLAFLQNGYISRYTFPWEDREKADYRKEIARQWQIQWGQIWYPQMPNKQNARYRDWKIVFEGILTQLHPEDVLTLVGGSLWGCFLLKYFADDMLISGLTRDPVNNHSMQKMRFLPSQEWPHQLQIHQIHLIASCIAEGDFNAPTNYQSLQSLGDRVHIWHAEDDPVVPFSVAKDLEKLLPDAQTHFFWSENGYGHFYGIERLPELTEILLKIESERVIGS